jgi:hypothetical protein
MALFAVALFGGGVIGSALGVWAIARSAYPALFAISCGIALLFTLAATLLRLRYTPQEAG